MIIKEGNFAREIMLLKLENDNLKSKNQELIKYGTDLGPVGATKLNTVYQI